MEKTQTMKSGISGNLFTLTDEQIEFLDKHTRESWKLNTEGKIDVKGYFDCSGSGLENFKSLRFGTVDGNFSCYNNLLTSLEGAPESVGVDFYCSYNSLVSLEGAPETVGGNFYCSDNSLRTLDGAPKTVGGDFFCYSNSLESLKGAPETIGGSFYSSAMLIHKRKWNPEGWLKALEGDGDQKQKQLILTLLSPEVLNKRLQEAPEKTAGELKGVWNSPGFADIRSQLVLPKGLEGEMDLLSDLDGIGL